MVDQEEQPAAAPKAAKAASKKHKTGSDNTTAAAKEACDIPVENLPGMKVDALRDLCKKLSMKSEGDKAELIERLSGMAHLAAEQVAAQLRASKKRGAAHTSR